ncbi:MAG: oxygen-independent coproporphyrinogen-3 oxidase [Ignavibacteria bacterium]|nr:oxygen-independent coproporphyrinogen-3 oxidase [Ignavibacteria bacterium]
MLSEIEMRLLQNNSKELAIDSIFLGGGTPSLIEPKQLEKIFSIISKFATIKSTSEITLESNPGTLTNSKLSGFKSVGINRLSIGVQSFNDDELGVLDRIHSAKEAENVVIEAYKSGYKNLSIDLIYAIPGQTLRSWSSTLNKAVKLPVNHISAYNLIYEEGTPLFDNSVNGKVQPASNDYESKLFYKTVHELGEAGFEQYEISNFAKAGAKCLHNLKYWRGEQYLGFGASACGCVSGVRYKNVPDVHKYISSLKENTLPEISSEILTNKQKRTELIFLGMRSEGVFLDYLLEPADFEKILNYIEMLLQMKLATLNKGILKLTTEGYAICDEISLNLIP